MIQAFITGLASYYDLPKGNEQHLPCRRQAWGSRNYARPQSARPAMEHWKDPSMGGEGPPKLKSHYS